MTRAVRPGEATLRGLGWLASVGPAPVPAWAAAMGWGRSTAISHASRLEEAGWLARTPMTRGSGSLLWATRDGVQMTGVKATPLAGAPGPTTWGHNVACAWVAAWLTSRDRRICGTRELLADDRWRGELRWIERDGQRRRGHRPDLLSWRTEEAKWMALEVELAHKSERRLRAILALHASWIAAGKTVSVMYVCANATTRDRVRLIGAEVGLNESRHGEPRTLSIVPLDHVQERAMGAVNST